PSPTQHPAAACVAPKPKAAGAAGGRGAKTQGQQDQEDKKTRRSREGTIRTWCDSSVKLGWACLSLARVTSQMPIEQVLQFVFSAVGVLPLEITWKKSGRLPLLRFPETNHQRRTPADEAVPASCDGENDPPQPLALLPGGDSGPPDPIPVQQQEQLALGDEEVEVHESALSIVEDDSYCAPIPIQQREQQIDDAKRKAKAEISTAIGARGRDERDSTTELVAAKERDEDLRPIAARSRVGESLGEVEEEEAPSMPTPRQRSGPSLCLADCDDNDPPVPIQQQVQLLALDDKAVKNKKKQEAKAGEQKSVMTFVDEEGSDRAPIPIHQQIHQFDDAKEKTTSEISPANGASGMGEEMEEDDVDLRPSDGSRAGASWGELEARVEVSSMPTLRNDAADARLAPKEEIPIYDGIVVPTVWTRLQTWASTVPTRLQTWVSTVWTRLQPWVEHVWSNWKPRELILVLVITLVVIGIVFVVHLLANHWN
ncbi:hypothetical protein THAOC_34825, partial [Thalassiosira oceanica]